jgi:hypothetical protein
MYRAALTAVVACFLVSLGFAAAQRSESAPIVEVFKSPTCGCCAKWVDYMRANGFTVRATNVENLTKIKTDNRVPDQLLSCHTAVVDGYVIEGHVPATYVRRVLKERPPVVGLAVADMPVGSPGMEVEGVKAKPFNVMSFDKQGTSRVFAVHTP